MIPGAPVWLSALILLFGGGFGSKAITELVTWWRAKDEDRASTTEKIAETAVDMVKAMREELTATKRDLLDERQLRRAAEQQIEDLRKQVRSLQDRLIELETRISKGEQ